MYLGYVDEETVLKKIFKDNKDFKVNMKLVNGVWYADGLLY